MLGWKNIIDHYLSIIDPRVQKLNEDTEKADDTIKIAEEIE